MEKMKEKEKEKESLSPVLPFKTKITLSFMAAVTAMARRSDGTINRRFLNFMEGTVKVRPKTAKGVTVSDITIDSTRNLWFRLFVPTSVADDSQLPVLVFFHGGGFCFLSPDIREYDALCRKFALKFSAIVVSVNYRLAPEHRAPAAYDDGFDTLKFLDKKSFEGFPTNADLSRCFLAGESAGGNLAHHMARRFAENEAEFTELKLIGLIAMEPFFGGEERTDSEIRLKRVPIITIEGTDRLWKAFLPQGANRDHEAANVFGPKSTDISNLKSFPATLVVVGGFDPLQDWQKRYYEGLRRSGITVRLIEYPKAIHGFYAFPDFPETSLLLTEMRDFIHNNAKIN